MASDVLVRGDSGWFSIYAGAVPDSVKVYDGAAFKSIVGLVDPPAETKFMRNLADDAWIPLDTFPPTGTAILRAEQEIIFVDSGYQTITDIPIGDPDPNRYVIMVVGSLFQAGESNPRDYVGSVGASGTLILNKFGVSGTDSNTFRQAMGMHQEKITTGSTVDITVRAVNSSYQGLAHYDMYIQVWTILHNGAGYSTTKSGIDIVSDLNSNPATMNAPDPTDGHCFMVNMATWRTNPNVYETTQTPQSYGGAPWTDAAPGSGYNPGSSFWSWSQREVDPAASLSTQFANVRVTGNATPNATGYGYMTFVYN
jgi:hypothetical protein